MRYSNTDSSTTPRLTITTKNNNKRRGHEREESDISITFTFSFDDAKPKGRSSKEVERLHSDVSVQFWEEVTQRKKTPKGPYHSLSSTSSDLGMSLPPIFFPQNSHTHSFSSENSPMVRSSIPQDPTQYPAQPSLLLSTSTTSEYPNDDLPSWQITL